MTGAPTARAPLSGPPVLALDGVRGLAIAAVMLYHFNLLRPGTTAAEARWSELMDAGWAGVDLFFVLSGFLITTLLLEARGRPLFAAWGRFGARRALRIFPLYYAFLAVSFFVLPPLAPHLGPGAGELVAERGLQPWFWLYVPNFLIAERGFGLAEQLNATWSLGVEEQFYVLWPLVVLLLPRRVLPAVFTLAALVALGSRLWLVERGAGWPGAAVYPWCRMDALALGGLLAWLVEEKGADDVGLRVLARAALFGGGALLVVVGVSLGHLHQYQAPVLSWGLSLLAVVSAGLVLAALTERPGSALRLLLERPLLTTLGKYAYGLYLLHVPVLHLVIRPWVEALQKAELLVTRMGTQLFISLAGTLVSLVVAALVYHLFELPFLRLKRFFPR